MQVLNKELLNIKLKRHQLIFIVNEQFKRDIKFVSNELAIPHINVNYELSKALKDIPLKRRSRKVNESLKAIVRSKSAETLVLDNIEILFDTQLQQNPVLLFEDISRNYTLIVGWKGKYYNKKLVYSEPEHEEYFTQDNTEGIIIQYK